MIGRLLRVTGTALVIAVALCHAGLGDGNYDRRHLLKR